MTYQFSLHSTFDKAADALESYYAEGEVSPCEFHSIKKLGPKCWAILLHAA
jgi:hypothetical protein